MARRPTLIYDGDCKFCARWVERWRVLPEIAWAISLRKRRLSNSPRSRSKNQTKRSSGWGLMASDCPAHRRFCSSGDGVASGRLLSLYHEPSFARVADTPTARLPGIESSFRVTRLLWGADVRVPTFAISWLFLRLLGVVYLLAFSSYWVQLSGLNGAKGILPAPGFLTECAKFSGTLDSCVPSVVGWVPDTALYAWCGADCLGRSY